MSDDALRDVVTSIFSDHLDDATPKPELDTALWAVLAESGLTLLTVPEERGGSGGALSDAGVLLSAAGEYAAPVPLAETDLLAGWLLTAAGLDVPSGPLTAAAGALDVRAEGAEVVVTGALPRVPWARAVSTVAVLTGDRVLLLPLSGCTLTEGANVAGEPRDTLDVDVRLPSSAVATAPAGAAVEFERRGALARALQITGAVARALDSTLRHAGEREQFGRPIGRFQAVQQQVALAAGEVAACRAATDAAVRVAETHGFGSDAAGFAVAAAKSRTSAAAGAVAGIAHQVHGAIGFTLEHHLRLVTMRMWAWRDEFGNEAYWDGEIGAAVLARGADGLWPLITA